MISDLRAAARAYLEDHDDPDPHDLAPGFLDTLDAEATPDLLLYAAQVMLMEAVRGERAAIRQHRRGGRPWHERADSTQALLRQRFLIPDVGWKIYGHCTPDEVDALAGDYFARAASLTEAGEECRRDAREAREIGVETMSDLYAARATREAEAA